MALKKQFKAKVKASKKLYKAGKTNRFSKASLVSRSVGAGLVTNALLGGLNPVSATVMGYGMGKAARKYKGRRSSLAYQAGRGASAMSAAQKAALKKAQAVSARMRRKK